MNTKIYPLQFEPILKERIWGGTKLNTLLDKPIVSNTTGESWEISTVEGDVSVVAHGNLAGKSLNDLIDLNPESILGTEVYKKFGKQFPLLLNISMPEKICLYRCILMMNWQESVIIHLEKRRCGILCKPITKLE